jgi:hypothetical protein
MKIFISEFFYSIMQWSDILIGAPHFAKMGADAPMPPDMINAAAP